jgi:hypothetical protein
MEELPADPAEGIAQQAPATRLFRRVYTVGFSQPADTVARKRPQDYSKEGFAVLLQERHADVFAAQAADGVPVNTVVKVMVFAERHADGNLHYYAVVQCARPYGCARLQKRLQTVDRVYTSFGTAHTYFWSAVAYASVPTPHKSPQEMDPEPYHSEGRTLREELADVPRGARPPDRRRVLAFLGIPQGAKKSKPMLDKEELASRIVAARWLSTADVVAAASATKDEDPALYNTVLNWGAQRVEDFVKWAWALEGGVPAPPPVDRIARLREVADSGECVCGGRWTPAAEYLLDLQKVDSRSFRALVTRALQLGRRKDVNVLVTGVPDAGKTFVFKPLAKIYRAFQTRGQRERFPLQGLPGCDVAVLQDVRYESFGLCWDDWLRWGDGETLMINVPRNVAGAASLEYEGTAPLFATMADIFHFPLGEARHTGRDVERENTQFRSRWRIVHFAAAIPPELRDRALEACGKCAAAWFAEVVEPAGPGLAPVEAGEAPPGDPPAPLLPLAAAPAVPPAAEAQSPQRKRLRRLPEHRL